MLKNIFLILTGENEDKRPRSKKLMEIIRQSQLKKDEYKIIVSGLSAFNLDVNSSESSRLAKYLIQKNIPKENIILEENSMDTLGNMIFSHEIIKEIIIDNKNQKLNISLITEGFHMKRSKKIFLRIFEDLKLFNKQINFNFYSANTFGISSFFWKRELYLIISKLKKNKKIDNDVKKYLQNLLILDKRYLMDFIIMDILFTDFDIFRLSIFDDYANYLFSLPIYNQKFKPKKYYNLKYSIYAKAINSLIENRKIN